MDKYEINLENQTFNKLFSETYIKICIWIPWVVLGILVFITMVEKTLKTWVISTIVWVIILNGLYIIYCFIKYKLIKKASSKG